MINGSPDDPDALGLVLLHPDVEAAEPDRRDLDSRFTQLALRHLRRADGRTRELDVLFLGRIRRFRRTALVASGHREGAAQKQSSAQLGGHPRRQCTLRSRRDWRSGSGPVASAVSVERGNLPHPGDHLSWFCSEQVCAGRCVLDVARRWMDAFTSVLRAGRSPAPRTSRAPDLRPGSLVSASARQAVTWSAMRGFIPRWRSTPRSIDRIEPARLRAGRHRSHRTFASR